MPLTYGAYLFMFVRTCCNQRLRDMLELVSAAEPPPPPSA
jgi:hypothetical protein